MSPDEESAELTFMSEQVLQARRLLQQALRSPDRAVPAEAAIENALLMSDRQGQLEPADLNVQELLERFDHVIVDTPAASQGAAIKKKDDTHRMAEANRAFAHYRW